MTAPGAFHERHEPPSLKIFNIEVSTAPGWKSFNDRINYRVMGDSLNPQSVQWRRVETTSPYMGGKYLVHATPDNVTESIGVYVMGEDQLSLHRNYYDLIDAFTQFNFQIRKTMDLAGEIWNCFPADYSADWSPVYTHNRMIPVKLQIPRLPTIVSEVNA